MPIRCLNVAGFVETQNATSTEDAGESHIIVFNPSF